MEKNLDTIIGANIRKRSAFLHFVRKLVLFTIPFWALIALYVYDDPLWYFTNMTYMILMSH